MWQKEKDRMSERAKRVVREGREEEKKERDKMEAGLEREVGISRESVVIMEEVGGMVGHVLELLAHPEQFSLRGLEEAERRLTRLKGEWSRREDDKPEIRECLLWGEVMVDQLQHDSGGLGGSLETSRDRGLLANGLSRGWVRDGGSGIG